MIQSLRKCLSHILLLLQICGRGKTAYENVGNRRFRVLIANRLPQYANADNRHSRRMLIGATLEAVHATGGRFIRRENATKRWFVVRTKMAREKVGHAFRDGLQLGRIADYSPPVSHQQSMLMASALTESMPTGKPKGKQRGKRKDPPS